MPRRHRVSDLVAVSMFTQVKTEYIRVKRLLRIV